MLLKNNKSRKYKIGLAIFIPIQIIFYSWFKNNPEWVENIYIPLIFNNIGLFFFFFSSRNPVSIGFTLFYSFLAYLVIVFFKSLFNKKINWANRLLSFFAVLSIAYFFYMILWGFAYHRRPIASIKELNIENITDQEIEMLAQNLIEKTNLLRKEISSKETQNTSIKKYFNAAEIGYKEIAKEKIEFLHKNTAIKPILGNTLMSWLNTAGIYTFWSGEANISTHLASFEAPYVICHEMAHPLGFASEEEANYLAYLACEANTEKIFKYSANNQALKYTMRAIYSIDSTKYNSYLNQIDNSVKEDWQYSKNLRIKYDVPFLDTISSYLYDLFLKSNSQSQGIKSYGLVVELLVGELRKNGNQL